MKLYSTSKDEELYYYFNAKGEKRWKYRHRYYDAFEKRREKSKQGFTSENKAYRELLEVRLAIEKGQVKQVEYNKLTVTDWINIWFETHKNEWELPTVKTYRNTIDKYIEPLLGKYKLAELDKTTYKRVFINKLLTYRSLASVRLYHDIFKTAIIAAVEDEILPRNRFTKIKIVKAPLENDKIELENNASDNYYTPFELSLFLTLAKEKVNLPTYTLIYLLAYTGLRKGEALGLCWKNVDFTNKTVTVERTRDQHGIRTPKTKNSYRTIKIDNSVISYLQSYQKWCKKINLSLGETLKENDLVFINSRGNPENVNSLNQKFKTILKNSNLRKISPHGLRHTHATILIAEKVPAKTIAERLGHTVDMLYKVYTHSFEALETESVDAFSDALKAIEVGFGVGF